MARPGGILYARTKHACVTGPGEMGWETCRQEMTNWWYDTWPFIFSISKYVIG